MSILSIIGLAIFSVIVFLFMKYYIITKMRMRWYVKQGLPEYSYYPVYGIATEWMDYSSKDNIATIKYLSYNEKFKNQDGIVTNIVDRALIILTNPNLINEFLQNQQNYIKFQSPLMGFKQFLGNGIALAEGEEWKRKRKFLSNIFKFDIIVNYLSNIRDISKKMLERNDLDSFNTQIGLGELTGAVSLSLFMGANIDDYLIQGKNPSHAIDMLCSEIYLHYLQPYPALLGERVVKMNLRESDRKINEKCKVVRAFMSNILRDSIKREKQQLSKKDEQNHVNLITLLLKEGHNLEKEEEIEDFLDLAFSVYFAAKDTTANFLCVILYYLISNPHVYKKAEEEVMKLPINYTFNDIQKLDYLQVCIKESLRINSSAPLIFTREAITDHTLGNYKISKGTFVNVGLITNQLDKQYFNDPLTFNPDRWFEESTNTMMKEHPFVYIPFSGGMRNCIGQHLANLQSKVILVEFIRKFKQPQLPKDFEFEMVVKQSYQIKNPLILKLEKRQQNQN